MQEIWKPIVGYEKLYEVSNLGKIISLNYGNRKILKFNTDKDGYSQVGLHKNNKGNTKKVHRLVAQHFIQNPSNLPIVMHLDNNPSNNTINNLRWGTKKENTIQMWNDGRAYNYYQTNHPMKGKFGKDNQCSKAIIQYSINFEFIREWASASESSRELSINRGNITACCLGIKWHKTTGGFIWRFKD